MHATASKNHAPESLSVPECPRAGSSRYPISLPACRVAPALLRPCLATHRRAEARMGHVFGCVRARAKQEASRHLDYWTTNKRERCTCCKSQNAPGNLGARPTRKWCWRIPVPVYTPLTFGGSLYIVHQLDVFTVDACGKFRLSESVV